MLLYISGQQRNRKREFKYEIDFKFFLHHRGLLKNYNKNIENHFKYDGLTFSSSPKKKRYECDTDQLNVEMFNCAVACSLASSRIWEEPDVDVGLPICSHMSQIVIFCGGVNGRRYRLRWLVKCLRVWFSIQTFRKGECNCKWFTDEWMQLKTNRLDGRIHQTHFLLMKNYLHTISGDDTLSIYAVSWRA